MSRKGRVVLWAVVLAALAGVFALYARPQTMVAISDMVWACFQ